MKKILTLGIAIMITFAVSAQKNVTKFMGIPVDGTKAEMIQKLKAKGFTYNSRLDVLEGKFNGIDVELMVITNHDKVWRIYVIYLGDIKADYLYYMKEIYNDLCKQFDKKEEYLHFDDHIIYGNIDTNKISYTESEYTAIYYQVTQNEKAEWKKSGHYSLPKKIKNKVVWFKIFYAYYSYGIGIFYDNEWNKPYDGEDL